MYDYLMYDLMRKVLTSKISAGFLHHPVNSDLEFNTIHFLSFSSISSVIVMGGS